MDVVRTLHGTHPELRPHERAARSAVDGLNCVAARECDIERRPVAIVDSNAGRVDRGSRVALSGHEDPRIRGRITMPLPSRAGNEASEKHQGSEEQGRISNDAHERLL